MGSKTTVETNETAQNTPPTWAGPGLEELGGRITSIIPTMPGERYTGDFLAAPSGLEEGMRDRYLQTADFMRQMSIPAMDAMNANSQGPSFQMSGSAAPRSFSSYDPTAIQPVIDAAIDPVYRRLMEDILPSIGSSGIESGSYGGTRNALTLPGQAIRDFSGEAGRIATGIGYQDFSDFENRNLQAYGLDTERGLGTANTLTARLAQFPDLIDTVLRMQTGATDTEAAAGAYDRTLRQNEIDNQLAQFDYGIRYPYQGLDVAASLLGNLAQPWGTQTRNGTQTTSVPFNWQQAIQGVAGVGMAAMGMPGGLGGLFANTSGKGG